MKKKKIIILAFIVLIIIMCLGIGDIIHYKNSKKYIESEDNIVLSVKKQNEKFGIVDQEGNSIVPFEFNEGYDYNNGVAVLKNENGSTYFNESGKTIGFPNTALDGPVETHSKDDYLAFKDSNTKLYGFINYDGTVVLPAMWKYVTHFCNGLALVGDDTGTYVIDKSGNMVISQKILGKYISINPAFENKLLIVYGYEQSCGVIDIDGKEIVKCSKDNDYIEISNEIIEVHKGESIIKYDINGNEIN